MRLNQEGWGSIREKGDFRGIPHGLGLRMVAQAAYLLGKVELEEKKGGDSRRVQESLAHVGQETTNARRNGALDDEIQAVVDEFKARGRRVAFEQTQVEVAHQRRHGPANDR